MKIDSKNFKVAKKYANDLVSGKKIANIEQVQAAQRFLDDLKSDKWVFRKEQFDFAVALIEKTIRHQQGQDLNGNALSGTPLYLLPWQKFIIVNLFGFFNKGTNIRRFNEALIFLPRKQGKTAFASALSWAKGIIDRQSGSKVYILASSIDQTKEAFGFLSYNIGDMRNDFDKFRLRDNNQEHSIKAELPDGKIEVIAKANQEDKLDSFNCNGLILDEIHSWKKAGAKKYTLMKNAMKAYRNKLLVGISTAGDVANGFLAMRIQTLKKFLRRFTKPPTL